MPISSITLDTLREYIFSLSPSSEVVNALKAGKSPCLHAIAGSLQSFLVSRIAEDINNTIIVITETRDEAEKIADDCSRTTISTPVVFFPETTHHLHALDISGNSQQVEALKALLAKKPVIFCTYSTALATKLPQPTLFSSRIIEIQRSISIGFQNLLDTLSEFGFEKKDFVEGPGDFSHRGGIIDVYPSVGDNPLRLEFWGDTLESIREFDPLSQRSIRELTVATIIPDVFSGPSTLEQNASIFSYLQSPTLIMLPEDVLLERSISEILREGSENTLSWEEIKANLNNHRLIRILSLSSIQEDEIDFGSRSQPSFNGSIHLLKEHLTQLAQEQYKVCFSCESNAEAERLADLLSEIDDSIQLPTMQFCTEALHSGFVISREHFAFFTEHEIFGRLRRRGSIKKRRFRGISQKELLQLQRGDYVVHVDYGIGKFDGLRKIKIRETEQEVVRLLYSDDDVLYVNLNYISRIQKYSSREGHIPILNKLGAPDWDRIKQRTKRKIKDIARDLIKLYARRKIDPGFAFSEDTPWQKELEASFMFEDTTDQATATIDIKRDMEAAHPMDRLICGDVGFGKTEVAIRAAFKAVMSGKQAGVLVPTTILAQQHYNTFADRLQRYAVHVEVLSRFRSKKEQTRILQRLASGEIDILIGTHRLLSRDVVFKDLGLLIIDEEHRFGVTAKEKLRLKKETVDTLTLTATPIPRTLHFSLMGARDLSLITTPPRNRLPVITEIAQLEPLLVREAILKEISRGGQIFFVHDRIEKIAAIADYIQRNIPEARIRIAHGQIKGSELEKVMMDFLERKFDVLVATKIIESGLDIPNVNTIIINRADKFGLAELYQLRGRVGRSNVQAYAYLLTPPLSSLPRYSLRRLQAIEEFTELGSGFNLAMRDLEIRGAGNLLGAEQSGYIMEMGFEMYTRILEDAVLELKKEEFEEIFGKTVQLQRPTETIIETDINALIPDIYVEHDSERLDVYRRLYAASDSAAIDEIRSELRDRFGEYPEEVAHLFCIVEIKVIAAKIGFSKIEITDTTFNLTFPPSDQKAFFEVAEGEASLFQKIIDSLPRLVDFQPLLNQSKAQLELKASIRGKIPQERLDSALKFMHELAEIVSDNKEY